MSLIVLSLNVLPCLLGNGKHFPFLYFKRTVVIPFDSTRNGNFYRHSGVEAIAHLRFYCCTLSY